MTTIYIRVSKNRAASITIDRAANQATTPDVDGGRRFCRLAPSGIAQLVDAARRGWAPTYALDEIDEEARVYDSVADAWDAG